MPSRAAWMVAREMPAATASWRKPASQRSKLPVFWQLLLGGGYLVGSADAVPMPAATASATAASLAVHSRMGIGPPKVGALLEDGQKRPDGQRRQAYRLSGPASLWKRCRSEERRPP